MIYGHMGRLGHGKTLSMTILGSWIKSKNPEYVLITNYQTEYTDIYVENPKQLDEEMQECKAEGKTMIILLDEVWAWMDARDTQRNEIMKNIVLNSRKRNAILFWTSQSDRQVDPILTDNTDYAVVPLHYEKIDPNNPYDYDVLIILVMNRNGEPESRHVVDVEPWYGKYDTDEEVSTKSDKEMFKDYIDEGLEMLRNKEIKHKKEMVSYLTLNKEISNNQAELLTDEIFRQHDPEKETEKGQQTLG